MELSFFYCAPLVSSEKGVKIVKNSTIKEERRKQIYRSATDGAKNCLDANCKVTRLTTIDCTNSGKKTAKTIIESQMIHLVTLDPLDSLHS